MDFKNGKSAIQSLTRHLKACYILVVVLSAVVLLEGALLWHQAGQRNVVLVPAGLSKTAWVKKNTLSASYLEAMAIMLVSDRLDISPETVDLNNNHILSYVSPSYYRAFKEALLGEADEIKTSKLSSTFYVKSVHVLAAKGQITIDGSLQRWVGERFISKEPKRYLLKFKVHNYVPLLVAFKEMPLDNNN